MATLVIFGADVLVSALPGQTLVDVLDGADHALAFVDEIEEPVHDNVRFTVGY